MSHQKQIRNHPNVFKATVSRIVRNWKIHNVSVHPNVRENISLHSAIVTFKPLHILRKLLDKEADIHTRNYDNYTPLDLAIQSGNTDAASLLMKKGALVGEDLNSLLLKAIDTNNDMIVKMIIDHGVQENPSINLIISLQAAISRGNSMMIEAIIPHCGFSMSSDLYFPRKFVINSDPEYSNCVELLSKWNFTINPYSHYDDEFIYKAVENGLLPIVRQLLEYEIDVNMVNSKTGLNLLTIACLNKHHDIMEILLEHNADVSVKTSGENEILNKNTCFNRNIREFSDLLTLDDHKNKLIDVTCLHIAIFHSDLTTINILLRYGAKIIDNAELFNLTCFSVHNNSKEIVVKFLEHGVKVTDINSYSKTLLHFSVTFNFHNKDDRYNIAELLLEKGAKIHLQTPGNSLVFEAIKNKHYKIAQLFLDNNADVQYINPDGHTSLHKAIKNKLDAKFIKTLLKLNSPVNTTNSTERTPLLDACIIESHDQLEIIESLLHNNADVNSTDKNMRTPLSYASNGRSSVTTKIMQLLVEHGADIEAVDNRGWTPLFVACNSTNYEAVQFLLDHNADPNHTDLKYSTPLHIAIEKGCVPRTYSDLTYRSVQYLIKYGANVDVSDGQKRTPLHNAIKKMIFYSNENLYQDDNFQKNCEIIIKTLVLQEIKLKAAGLKVKNHHSNGGCNTTPKNKLLKFTMDSLELK